MIPIIAAAGAIAFAALAGLHAWWAFGGGGRALGPAVIPTRPDGTPIMAPGRGMTLAVAALLLASAFLMVERGGLGPGLLSPGLREVGCAGVAVVLLLRGIGDFRYVGLFKRERTSRFGRMDTRYYTPLVLTLSALAGLVAAWGS
jgi:uncharacterized protein DUF3995